MSRQRLERLFADPPSLARVAPFWFLNHELTPEETRWQVAEMDSQGVGGFVLHPRHGLITPYMSEEWMVNLEAAIDEARRRGMKAFLYDENNWPSGPADAEVFKGHPEYRMSGLFLAQRLEVQGGALHLDLQIGDGEKLVAIVAVPFEDGQASGFPETARLLNDGLRGQELATDLPEGQWVVYVFVRRFMVGTFFGSYLDTLSGDAVRRFIALSHDRYAQRFEDDFGATIEGIFTDEPSMNFNARDAAPWTPELPGEFGWRKGYDLLIVLPALFEDLGPATAHIRCDVYDVVTELYSENFFGQIYRWCDRRRIKLMGHPMQEGELIEHARQQGDWFRIMRYMHWGGVDQLCELTWPEQGGHLNNLAGPKLAASAAHLLGKSRTDCECFGLGSQWSIDLRTLKWMGDWLACMGVNFFIPHAFYYSIQGFRKWECPPGEFYQSPFWPYYRAFADHIGRLAALLSNGTHVADVAFFYPIRSMWAELSPHATETAKYLQDHFNMLGEALLRAHRDFDFVSEEMLARARVRDGLIFITDDSGVERESFRVLVLPALTTLSLTALDALERLVAQGARVLATGTLPTKSAERGVDPELQQRLRALFGDDFALSLQMAQSDAVSATMDMEAPWHGAAFLGLPRSITPQAIDALEACLSAAVEADVRIRQAGTAKSAPDVLSYHWRREGMDFYVLHNTSRETGCRLWAELGRTGEITLWDPDTGTVRPAPVVRGVDRPQVLLDLPAVGTLVIGCEAAAGCPSTPLVDADLSIVSVDDKTAVGLADRTGKYHVTVGCPTGERVVSASVGRLPEPVVLADEWQFETAKPNALPLVDWQMRAINHVTGRDHASARLEFSTIVECEIVPEEARLLLDGLIVEKVWQRSSHVAFEVRVNGERVQGWQTGQYLDHYIYEALVEGLLKAGRNEVVVVTTTHLYEMPALRYPVILTGRFAVSGARRPKVIAETDTLTGKGWDRQGYPYYSGIGVYRQWVNLTRAQLGCRLFLDFDRPGDLAEVFVNDSPCGVRAWEPWRVEITEAAKTGANLIEVRAANSLQNLLVQEPKPSGLLGTARIVACKEITFDLSS